MSASARLAAAAEVLKKRFPNLTVSETIKIISDILEALDAEEKK